MAVVYLTTGTEWEVPDGVDLVYAEAWGGGEAGIAAANGAGGRGGAYARAVIDVSALSTVPYTIGAGGTTSGENGGDTTFLDGSTLVAPGGGSATSAVGDFTASGGTGGTAGNSAGGGGGGAGGPDGNGGNGGSPGGGVTGGGGGGGSNGGGNGANGSGTTGGNGGTNTGGSAGTGGTAGNGGGNGSNGAGGGGSGAGGGAGGGNGGANQDEGGGGGGGTHSASSTIGGDGGFPGGGGGGGTGPGGAGQIKLSYGDDFPTIPITVRNNATVANSTAATDRTISGTRTVAAGTGMLVAIVRLEDANDLQESGNPGTITGGTIDGQAFTAATGVGNVMGDDDNCLVGIWYIANPPIGSNLSFSFTTDSRSDSSSLTWIEVVPGTPGNTLSIGATNSAVGTSGTNIGGTLDTTAAGSMIIAGCCCYGGDTDPFTPDAGDEMADGASGTSTSEDHGYSALALLGGAPGTHNCGFTSSASDGFAWAAVEIVETAPGIDLEAEAGSYTLTGTAAALERGREVAADAGSYAVTGQAANVEHGREVAADAGSYALSGTDAGLSITDRVVEAGAGSYALTGADASLERGREVAADAGSYALTGADAGLATGQTLAADAGSYALSGTDAALAITDRVIEADAGSYAVTGTDVALEIGREVSADTGTYALTGQDAALEHGREVAADSGSYALNGTDAALAVTDRVAAADAGAYALTGTDAALSVTDKVVEAAAGSYALTGTDADLAVEAEKAVSADAGSYTLTGADAGMTIDRLLSAEGGIYLFAGADADLTVTTVTPPGDEPPPSRGGILVVDRKGRKAEEPQRRPSRDEIRAVLDRLANPPPPSEQQTDALDVSRAERPVIPLTEGQRAQVIAALSAVPQEQLLDYGLEAAVEAAAKLIRELEQDEEEALIMIVSLVV